MKKIIFFLLLPALCQAQTFTEISKIAKDSSPVIISNFTQMGSPLKGHTINFPLQYCNTASALTDGQIRWVAVQVEKDCTINGIKVFLRTAGNYTGNNTNGAALYSMAGGTLTKIAESANTPQLFATTANTLLSIPFTTPVTNCKAGIYIAAILYNNSAQTTAPAISSGIAMSNVNMSNIDNTNGAKLFGSTNSATLPATQLFSGITATTTPTFIQLY